MFYGWYIVFASYLAVISSMPGHSFGVTMFLDSWQEDLNLSKINFSWLWLIACVASGILTVIFGFLIGKFGASKIMPLVSIIYLAVVIGLSFVEEIYQLGILITLTRLLGPEVIMLICQTTIAKWFDKKLGKVISSITWIEMIFMAAPIAVNAAIISLGWRNTYRIIAGLNCLLLIPINLVIVDSPEKKNCLPDGEERPTIDNEIDPEGVTVEDSKAYYNPMYWMLVLANTLFGLFWSGFNILAPDIIGLSNTDTAMYLFLPVTITIFIGATTGGYILDRIDRTQTVIYCTILKFLISILIILNSYIEGDTNFIITFGVFYGFIIGQWITCMGTIFAKLFSKKDLAEIQGISVALAVISAGVGPMLIGYTKLVWGSYVILCWILGLLIFGIGCFFVWALTFYYYCLPAIIG